ncbi:MAG: hypothetical protein ACLFST_10005 [Spirochaetia bacterium]
MKKLMHILLGCGVILLTLLAGCPADPELDMNKDWLHPDAEALYAVSSITSRETADVDLYQLLPDGSTIKVALSDLPVQPSGSLLLVTGIKDKYVLLVFGTSLNSVSSAYLLRLVDGSMYDLGSVGSVKKMINYYHDPPSFQIDGDGKVYFLSDDSIYRVDTSTENPTAQVISATGDRVDYFEVSSKGYVAYRTWDDDVRLVKPDGGLVLLPSSTFWAGQDGDIYYHKYTYEYNGQAGGFYQIFHVIIDETEYLFDIISEDVGYMTVPWSSFKASTSDRVFIADDYIYRYVIEVGNPSGQPRRLSFLPEFQEINFMTGADNDLLITALTDTYHTYRVDPDADTYERVNALSGYEIRSMFGLESDRYLINGLRLSDGKLVVGILDEADQLTIIEEESDKEILYLARLN